MPTFLQVVSVPERCFLQEVLLWVAFQRLPTTAYDSDGIEVHESKEVFDSAPDYPDIGDEFLSDEECSRGGIPSDPYLKAILEGKSTSEPAFYEKLLKTLDADDPQRGQLERDKERAILFEAEGKAWRSQYEQAVEYPASRIFVALRSGSLTAQGRLLPAIDIDKAIEMLDEGGGRICDIEPSGIPVTFWSLKGITFEQSAANSDVARYCHITCATRDMLALFPGEREAIGAVERVGDTFVLGDLAEKPPTNALRGRPAYPWDGFHVEVAAMVQNGTLPQKKEAAIHHFQQWFKQEHGILPSRAAVGDKLRPYYAKFLQADGQKSSRRFSV
jgi:hypothetical protein